MYARRPLVPSWAELTSQENDNLFIIPKLIWAALARLDRWNAVREMWVVLGAMMVAAGLLAFLWHRTVSRGRLPQLLPLALASLVFFTPAQHENLLWGIQLIVFIPLIALLAICASVRSAWAMPVVFIVSAVSCVVATFSWSSGLLLWPLSVPLILVHRPEARRAWVSWSLWGACALVAIALFLMSLHPEAAADPGVTHGQVPDISTISGQWLPAAEGLLAFLGSSLSYTHHRWIQIDKFDMAIMTGSAVLVGMLLSSVAVLGSRRSDRLQVLVLWSCVAAYGLGSGVLAVLGRFAFGPQYMLSSRYIAFSGPVIIATMALVTVALGELFEPSGRLPKASALVGAVLAVVVTVIALRNALDGEAAMRELHRVRLQGKAALQFLDLASDEQLTLLDFTGPRLIRLRAPELYASGAFVDVRSRTRYHEYDARTPGAAGCIESGLPQAAGRTLTGWAYLLRSRRPADGILISPRSGPTPAPVALATPTVERPEIAKSLGTTNALHTGWHVTAPDLPGGTAVWAFDAERNEAFELTEACRP